MPKQLLTVAGARHKGHGHVEQIEDREAMLRRREEILAKQPEVKLARELGPLMGEYERAYWLWTVEKMEQEITRLHGPTYIEVKSRRAV